VEDGDHDTVEGDAHVIINCIIFMGFQRKNLPTELELENFGGIFNRKI